jgi:hypothetical protein
MNSLFYTFFENGTACFQVRRVIDNGTVLSFDVNHIITTGKASNDAVVSAGSNPASLNYFPKCFTKPTLRVVFPLPAGRDPCYVDLNAIKSVIVTISCTGLIMPSVCICRLTHPCRETLLHQASQPWLADGAL